jgi:DNA anti-recombination protein RmuC
VSGELVGNTHKRLEDAAAAAAASFGEVLRGISESEVQQFTTASGNALQARTKEFEQSSQQLLRNLESAAGTSLEYFHEQMASELATRTSEGRAALAAEFAAALSGYRAERDSHQEEWLASLEQMSNEAASQFQERLQTTGDSWVLSSVRRLNEHGQDAVESLMRSADQSLRDSCAKLFEGLSEMLRDRATNAAGVSGFTPTPTREVAESKPTPRNEVI